MNAADHENYSTWNKLAEVYAQHFMDLDLYNASYVQFCELLSTESPSLLEIGCGPGNITRHLVELLPKARILATDFSENMVEEAQKHSPTVEFQVLDARKLNSLDQKFDGILCGFVIPYLSPDDCHTFLQECTEKLHSEGLLYLSFVPGAPADSGYITGSSGDRCFFHYYEKNELLSRLHTWFRLEKSLDLAYTKSNGSSETHTILIARKSD